MKYCKDCNTLKNVFEFYKDSTKSDGLCNYCKLCKSKRCKERWNKNNKKANAQKRDYYKKNKSLYLAKNALARAVKLKATPSWLTDEHKEEMKNIYIVCKTVSSKTNKKHHVDHIVPLKGYNICGLHVPWNLAIIPQRMNLAKSNTFNSWEDSDNHG